MSLYLQCHYRSLPCDELPTPEKCRCSFEEGEVLFDLLAHTTVDFEAEVTDDSAMAALRACKEKYQGVARKGVEAIELKLQGYESVEIADLYGTTVNNVNAWISRARSKLRNEPALMEILC